MESLFFLFVWCFVLLPVAESRAEAGEQDQAAVRRYALLVAAHDGGPGRPRLRYASSDVQNLAKVLEGLGGVNTTDLVVLEDPGTSELKQSFASLAVQVTSKDQGDQRSELLFYYSGHSDENGILLGDERFSYAKLRKQLEGIQADVRVVVLDSCSSGSLTRLKGGRRVPAFMVDASSEVTGQAILTSSSADEAAQESDALKASFFTHYLVSGLRGAADTTADQRVTLNEAYQFAFHETLRRTEKTLGGAQHPAYDIQLSGRGDLVLTDLRHTSATLQLAEDVSGRLFVRNEAGRLVVELDHPGGRKIALALDRGAYDVVLQRGGKQFQAYVDVGQGTQNLSYVAFQVVDSSDGRLARAKGEAAASAEVSEQSEESAPYETVEFGVDFLPFVGMSSAYPRLYVRNFSMNIIGGLSAGIDGMEIGSGLNIVTEFMDGMQIVGGFNYVGGPVSGIQVAGGGNFGEELDGVQIAGGLNIAAGQADAVQVAGGVNYASGFERGYGVQIAGGTNIAGGSMPGVQVAGGLNLTASLLQGVQVAPFNIAADGADGAQIGVLNISGAKINGVQVGLINIAETSDYSLGLINIFWDGETRLDLWGTDSGFLYTGIKHGGERFYNIYGFGTRLLGDDVLYSPMLGLGARLWMGDRWFVDSDAVAASVFDSSFGGENSNMLNQLRVIVGWQPTSSIAVWGGLTGNVLVAQSLDADDIAPIGRWRLSNEGADTEVSAWPGLSLGVQFF